MSSNDPSLATCESIWTVVRTPDMPDLGPHPRQNRKTAAELMKELEPVLAKSNLGAAARDLILGGALLWHDHLGDAHAIAQDIANADGSLLHGLMHRREPDYDNARYWFRRVGVHPCFAILGERLNSFEGARDKALFSKLLPGGRWDPFAFIAACEEGKFRPMAGPRKALLQEIQTIEFESWLQHLCGANVGVK